MATKPSKAGQGLGLLGTFINGVRSILESTYGKTVHNLERMADPRLHQIVAAYLAGLPVTIGETVKTPSCCSLQLVERTIPVTMDLSKTVAQLIGLGKYDWVNPEFVNTFQADPGTGKLSSNIELLYYGRSKDSEDVLADMAHHGLRAATFLELLWIGIRYPQLQLGFPIVALGSVVERIGGRRVAYLDHTDLNRNLDCHLFDFKYYSRCRFAAVRLPVQAHKRAA